MTEIAHSTETDNPAVALKKDLVRTLLDDVWSDGDGDAIARLVTPDYVHHDPHAPARTTGPEGLASLVASVRAAVPDLARRVEALYVDRDTVVARYTATGTHRGTLFGREPTDEPLSIEGAVFCRIRGGRIAVCHDLWTVVGAIERHDADPVATTRD